MTVCNKISIPKPKICAGDLNRRITLYKKPIRAPGRNKTNVTFEETVIATVWAAIETVKGNYLVDGVSRDDIATDLTYIRYRDDVDADDYFLFKNYRYEIKRVENLNKYDEYLMLVCLNTGAETKQGSQV